MPLSPDEQENWLFLDEPLVLPRLLSHLAITRNALVVLGGVVEAQPRDEDYARLSPYPRTTKQFAA